MKIKTFSVTAQRKIVHNTNSFEGYVSFHKEFFRDSKMWLNRVRQDIETPSFGKVDPEYFQFLTLVGMLVSQYGFPFLEGQLQRHDTGDFKRSPVSARHQLAVAIFMARLNHTSYAIKKQYIAALKDESLDNGVWGMHMPIYESRMKPFTNINEVRDLAKKRIAENKKGICLPDKVLNQGLAALSFTSADAESMTDVVFNDTVKPKLQGILKEWVQITDLFVDRH